MDLGKEPSLDRFPGMSCIIHLQMSRLAEMTPLQITGTLLGLLGRVNSFPEANLSGLIQALKNENETCTARHLNGLCWSEPFFIGTLS